MKFAVSTILFAGAGIFFSAVAGQQDPKKFDFLRAWVDPGDDTTVPPISHYVEIDMAGNAVINMTDGSQGVKSYIDPTPERGTLHTYTGESGYLVPVPGPETAPRQYQLKYSKEIPTTADILYKDFITVGRDCGGNCGGPSLDYYHGDGKVKGEWYIIPDTAKASRKVWALRWIARTDQFVLPVIPETAISVLLWKN